MSNARIQCTNLSVRSNGARDERLGAHLFSSCRPAFRYDCEIPLRANIGTLHIGRYADCRIGNQLDPEQNPEQFASPGIVTEEICHQDNKGHPAKCRAHDPWKQIRRGTIFPADLKPTECCHDSVVFGG